jgi:methyl-accepting chemotaxis protein
MYSLSIKNRLIISILIAVVVSTSVVAFVAQLKSRELLLNRLENSELPNLVQRVGESINGDISQMKAIAKAIASNTFIEAWVDNGEDAEGEKRLVSYLGQIAKNNGLSNASYIDLNTANYWNQAGFLRQLKNDNQDGWFFAFKATGLAESASSYTYPDGSIDIFVNYQQVKGRSSSGVSKSFNDIAESLNQFKIEKSGFVYLADKEGLIKVHKNRDFVEKSNVSDIYPHLHKENLFSEQPFAFQQAGDFVISTSYIKSLGWYVVAEVPKSELYAGLNESRHYMLMVFIIVTALFVGISIIISSRLVKPIKDMAKNFHDLGKGEGDLTYQVDENGPYEISELARGFNDFVANIRTVVQDVKSTSKNLNQASENVYRDANATKVALDKQRDEAHQVSVAINQMGSTIAEIANSASVAAQTTNDATRMTAEAQLVVNESTETINQMTSDMEIVSSNIEVLAKRSNTISSVLDVIRSVSEQTNLLALNAAIEAARAGEHGRGFAVVADEVRTLAQKTNKSTDEIHQMITELQEGSKTAVDSVHKSRQQAALGFEAAQKTKQALNEIVENVKHISDLNTQIATATEEQSAVINEINVHVVNISESTEQSVTASENIESSSNSLKSMATSLSNLVERFKA